jgi:hypothetical protein
LSQLETSVREDKLAIQINFNLIGLLWNFQMAQREGRGPHPFHRLQRKLHNKSVKISLTTISAKPKKTHKKMTAVITYNLVDVTHKELHHEQQ